MENKWEDRKAISILSFSFRNFVAYLDLDRWFFYLIIIRKNYQKSENISSTVYIIGDKSSYKYCNIWFRRDFFQSYSHSYINLHSGKYIEKIYKIYIQNDSKISTRKLKSKSGGKSKSGQKTNKSDRDIEMVKTREVLKAFN